MGRVLLSGLDESELDAFLQTAELNAFTRATVTDQARLRKLIARVRRQGWAMVDQELEDGLRSVAVPIRNSTSAVVAAMNLSTQASRRTPAAIRRELLPPLRKAAAAIEADLAAGRVP